VTGRKGAINGSDMTRREAAEYTAALADGLKSIAQAAGLPPYSCLLAMAREESPRLKLLSFFAVA